MNSSQKTIVDISEMQSVLTWLAKPFLKRVTYLPQLWNDLPNFVTTKKFDGFGGDLAQHCCKPVQTTCSINLSYLRLSSILLVTFCANFPSRLLISRLESGKHECCMNKTSGNYTIWKSSYCKARLTNFSALVPVHSVETRSQFLSLAWTLACFQWLKNFELQGV